MKVKINTYLVALSQNKFAQVDPEGWEKVKAFKWSYAVTGYAVRSHRDKKTKEKQVITMHRVLLNAKKGQVSDHINGDKLDNNFSNLRICTQSENVKNRTGVNRTSKYKGVSWEKRRNKWLANISSDEKRIYLGQYETEKNAALAYDKGALKYHKTFARLNFPESIK